MLLGKSVPTGDTADSYTSLIIASRFRVYSGQARAASLAVTVRVAAPADLLRRGARVALASCMLAQVGRRDRFNTLPTGVLVDNSKLLYRN